MSCFEVGNTKNNRSLLFTEGDFYRWLLYFYYQPHLCASDFLKRKKRCSHQKPLLHITQEHKGSKCYCHMPLPPEDKTRQKCHNSGSITIAFHSGTLHLHPAHQDTQLSLHPTRRAHTRQDLGTPTEQDSASSSRTQQPHFCHCVSLSPSRPTHGSAA